MPEILVYRSFAGPAVNRVYASQHAPGVTVQNSPPFSVRLRQNRSGGGTPDAGQTHELLKIRGKFAGMILRDQSGGLQQIVCARVIAQPRPDCQQLVFACIRQCRNAREGRHEALEVGLDGLDTGLLQHDFRYPYAIGGAALLPGEVLASVLIPPGEKSRSDHRLHCRAVCRIQAMTDPGSGRRSAGWPGDARRTRRSHQGS